VTDLLNRPITGSSTLHPPREAMQPWLRSAEEFYLHGAESGLRRVIEIRVTTPDGILPRTWLAEYMEQKLNQLLRLQMGWDGHRGRPITEAAVTEVVGIALTITDDLSLPPQIFPLADGGIQLEWHAYSEDIEIEVDGAGSAHLLAVDPEGTVFLDAKIKSTGDLSPVAEAVRAMSRRVASGSPLGV
jgi:hypothetical protein